VSLHGRKEVIGDCTLYLGDCREILPELGVFETIVTDPPYGMNYRSRQEKWKQVKIANDDTTDSLAWICAKEAIHSKYVFCRWDGLLAVPTPNSCITWVKNNWTIGDVRHEHARQTEMILFYAGKQHFFPGTRPCDVVTCPKTQNEYHPTEKPLALMRTICGWTSGTVVDPFMGSGTTGVASVALRRRFIGIEINPNYFEVACKRITEASRQLDLFVVEQESTEQLRLQLEQAS